jgi:hypothetical protein
VDCQLCSSTFEFSTVSLNRWMDCRLCFSIFDCRLCIKKLQNAVSIHDQSINHYIPKDFLEILPPNQVPNSTFPKPPKFNFQPTQSSATHKNPPQSSCSLTYCQTRTNTSTFHNLMPARFPKKTRTMLQSNRRKTQRGMGWISASEASKGVGKRRVLSAINYSDIMVSLHSHKFFSSLQWQTLIDIK